MHGFIKLHESKFDFEDKLSQGDLCFINVAQITSVQTHGEGGAHIEVSSGDEILVFESVPEVMEKIALAERG